MNTKHNYHEMEKGDVTPSGQDDHPDAPKNYRWAIVELMGHGLTAGILLPSDLGGLTRIDVPIGDGFRTEYFGEKAIYSIKIVSEVIARAYAKPYREAAAYDAPIVLREEVEDAYHEYQNRIRVLEHQNEILQTRLIAIEQPDEFSSLSAKTGDDGAPFDG